MLGYTALELGLGTAVMTVMAVVGSAGGRAIVTRLGFRSVAVMGLALTGGPNRLSALTEGFQAAFTAAIVFRRWAWLARSCCSGRLPRRHRWCPKPPPPELTRAAKRAVGLHLGARIEVGHDGQERRHLTEAGVPASTALAPEMDYSGGSETPV